MNHPCQLTGFIRSPRTFPITERPCPPISSWKSSAPTPTPKTFRSTPNCSSAPSRTILDRDKVHDSGVAGKRSPSGLSQYVVNSWNGDHRERHDPQDLPRRGLTAAGPTAESMPRRGGPLPTILGAGRRFSGSARSFRPSCSSTLLRCRSGGRRSFPPPLRMP